MALYEVTIKGITPLLMNNGQAGLDNKSPLNMEKAEITKKKTADRTEADIERLEALETEISMWLDRNGSPTIPPTAVRAMIETSARKGKEGPKVREGMLVDRIVAFNYDKKRYGTKIERLAQTTRNKAVVVVQRNRIVRTRAEFDIPWGCVFRLDCDDELIDQSDLETWIKRAGQRVGLGDWRPEKSGEKGRFELVSIKAVG